MVTYGVFALRKVNFDDLRSRVVEAPSLRSAAPPSLGAATGHSVRPGDERLGALSPPSRSNPPWSAELPSPSGAKTPSFRRHRRPFGLSSDCDCIIVYSAVSSTPMTDGWHALTVTGSGPRNGSDAQPPARSSLAAQSPSPAERIFATAARLELMEPLCL